MKLKDTAPGKESYDKPRQHIKKQRHHFADKGPYGQSYGFSNSCVWLWELDHKEDWAPKNWCFWTVVLEMTLESPLDSKKIKPANSKGNQPWIFIGRNDAEAQALVHWLQMRCEELTHWKRHWCWKNLRAGEGGDRGWDVWMASPTQWTQVWANSGRWWRIGNLVFCHSWGCKSQTQLSNWTTIRTEGKDPKS